MTYLHTFTLSHLHQITCTAAARIQTPHQPGDASNANVRVGKRRTTILLEAYVWD